MELHDALTLGLNTDVVEWCPASALRRFLAVGTYQLDESSGRRDGRLHLYSLGRGASGGGSSTLTLRAALDLPGIFDLRWHPTAQLPFLAAALADGSVRLLSLGTQPVAEPQLEQLFSTGAQPQAPLAVSLDYARCPGMEGATLAVSFSDGTLQQFQAAPTSLVSLLSWQAHELEAWAAASDYWHDSVIYSGGDDCAFKVWDTRQGVDAPAWANRKAHGAGVCCVASSPHQQHIVATGSYDELARIWDLRMPYHPMQIAEVSMGGGIWRLKWHPTDPYLLLAACMHAGFAVLRTEGAVPSLGVAEEYPHQKTLAYGADWCREVGEDGTSIVATGSFYDKLLHVWSPAVKAATV